MTRETKALRKPQPVVQIFVGLLLLAMGLMGIYQKLNGLVSLAAVILGAVSITVGGVVIGVRQALRQVLREELNPPPKEKVLNLQ